MIKRLNKRGQEGVGLGTLLIIIVGAVGLVLVIIGMTMGWDAVYSFFGKTKVDVVILSSTCNQYATSADLGKNSYCVQESEVGKNRYVNCPYAVVTYGIIVADSASIHCPGDPAISICSKLQSAAGADFKPEKVYVNDILCKVWLDAENEDCVTGFKGKEVCTAPAVCSTSSIITNTFKGAQTGKVCCAVACGAGSSTTCEAAGGEVVFSTACKIVKTGTFSNVDATKNQVCCTELQAS